MKIHTTNYINTFIEIAEDCPVEYGQIPVSKGEKKSVAEMQYELLIKYPYKMTSDDIIFRLYADRNNLPESEYEKARDEFFSKGQACFRASPLTKKYGFGIHYDNNGKMALYGYETPEYKSFVADPRIKKVKAMRTSKK